MILPRNADQKWIRNYDKIFVIGIPNKKTLETSSYPCHEKVLEGMNYSIYSGYREYCMMCCSFHEVTKTLLTVFTQEDQ